ncbi:similar to 1-phosphatidylinositol-4,5-bisphosphate phosphodiesterase 1 [Plenodomus lingam JN3]|uniref:Phosphoinositide phospholipase C n=1 Tax=Leptosphaeria maculans (strain JN3 / isolate v23.1.3 / race Av1-4-5-6-7-8) TaxID=985895 RepID=E5A599_LEPMJ|nr:similar to 1-phosphatidylinositol-4,5-bisphosphate phosphodiesterase 1 [Plenodomus lingam JN3]CBX98797.1 similar to 1-phosphatidylinositol-4,5-bisphosphate phosphodiesterase 1 [Plenodomus lingam JN3]
MSLFQDSHARPRLPSPQPTLARMSTAINIPNARSSPALTASYLNGSLQSTPEGIVPMSASLPAIPSYHLPEPIFPPPSLAGPTSSPSTKAEALGKGPGLIRRVSRGAQRLRRGNNTSAQRDKSSGPVIMRRRSDSRTAADGESGLSDFDAFEEEDAVEDPYEAVQGLGISHTMPMISSIPDSAVIAPVRNSRLEKGTVLKKVTKKTKKEINLRLDLESAKVFWDPSRPSKAFYIDDVKEIRSGPEAKHYREECGLSEAWAPYWFTIVYTDTTRSKGRLRTMHLIAPDVGVLNMWTRTLDSVSRNRIDMMAGLLGFADKSARLVWQRAMKKRDAGEESLDFQSIVELCRNLHINCSEATIRFYFNDADKPAAGKLNQPQFLSFVRRLKERTDIKDEIWNLYVPKPQQEMDQATFFRFLQQEQGVDVSSNLDHWASTFEKFARATRPRATPTEEGQSQIPLPITMNFPAFQTYLTSGANSILKPVVSQQKLDRPLNEYYISSSHNTYLLGRQVAGESSTEAYISALQKGCRCLEIDCWDGADNTPVVMHGRTLTKSILFQDTIKVINKYAFTESPYPVILSLEVHCSAVQQTNMVKIMLAEFGDKLVLQPLDSALQTLPTPEELKHRILIKVKAAAGEELDTRALMNELSTRRARSFSSPWSRPVVLNDSIIPNSPLLSSPPSMSPPERTTSFWASPRTSNHTLPTSAIVSSAEDSDSPNVTAAETMDDRRKQKKKTSNITRELGNLGVYTRGVKFSDFSSNDANTFNHVFSINERAFEKLTKPGAREKHLLEDHNMRCLMRVYPHAFRINSSNFDPLKFWRRGVQMAALNWQTYDLGQQLNEAMFAGGDDRTGYVLKPAALRLEAQTPALGHRKAPKKQVKFTVKIISAQQLPRPRGLGQEANINPYVEFEMYCAEDMGANATGFGGQDASARNGHSGIGNPLRKRTRIVEGNGYNPVFGNEIDMTVTTRYPSLVFVRWTVWNSLDARTTNHAPLATFTAKLDSVQQGFRHLPLFDSNGEQYLFSTLFCKIKKQDIVDAPEATSTRSSSRRPSLEGASSLQESINGNKSSRSFVRRLISRAPSERKKRMDERMGSDSRESDLDHISRASTFSDP